MIAVKNSIYNSLTALLWSALFASTLLAVGALVDADGLTSARDFSTDKRATMDMLDDAEQRWASKPGPGYFESILAIANELLRSGSMSDADQDKILSLLRSSLSKEARRGIERYSLVAGQAKLVPLLLDDSNFQLNARVSSIRCSIAAEFFSRVNSMRDPDYEPQPQMMTIPPIIKPGLRPGDVPVGAGMNPDSIKDLDLRRQYEEQIEENRRKSELNTERVVANQIYDRFESDVAGFFQRRYVFFADDQGGRDQVRQCIESAGFSEEFLANVISDRR